MYGMCEFLDELDSFKYLGSDFAVGKRIYVEMKSRMI